MHFEFFTLQLALVLFMSYFPSALLLWAVGQPSSYHVCPYPIILPSAVLDKYPSDRHICLTPAGKMLLVDFQASNYVRSLARRDSSKLINYRKRKYNMCKKNRLRRSVTRVTRIISQRRSHHDDQQDSLNQFARVSMRFPADIRASVAGGSDCFRVTFLPYLWVSNTLVNLLDAHPLLRKMGFP